MPNIPPRTPDTPDTGVSFESYLTAKKIDAMAFSAADARLWQQAHADFAQLGPQAFDQRKKFFINDWRLRFPLRGV